METVVQEDLFWLTFPSLLSIPSVLHWRQVSFYCPCPTTPPPQILCCVLAISIPSFNIFLFLFWCQWLRAKYVNRSLWDTQNLSSQHRWCSILIRGEVSEYGGRQILWPSVEWDPPPVGVKMGGILGALSLCLLAVARIHSHATQGRGWYAGALSDRAI